MTSTTYPSYRSRFSFLTLSLALALTQLHAVDYTWQAAANDEWAITTNWSPTGDPGTGDNIIGTTTAKNLEIRRNETIDNLSYSGGAGSWSLVGIGVYSLTINDTVGLTGTDTLVFRKSSGDTNILDITTNNLTVSNTGTLLFGSNKSLNNINNLTVTGTTTVSNGQLRLNIANNYSLGLVNASGSGVVVLSSAIENTGAIQVTTTGLIGTGGAIQGPAYTGNTATLKINGSDSYSSATVLEDSGGTLAVLMDATGTQELTGNNTYTGGTQVDNGTLLISDSRSLGDGILTVNGGTLQSTVTSVDIAGNFIINGGTVGANGVDTGSYAMAAGQDLTLDGGTLQFTYDSVSETFDTVTSADGGSSFDLNSGLIDLTNADWDYSITYTLLDGFGSGNIGDIDFINYDTSNWQASISSDGILSFSAIPEPSSSFFIFPILCGLLVLRHRRCKVSH